MQVQDILGIKSGWNPLRAFQPGNVQGEDTIYNKILSHVSFREVNDEHEKKLGI